MTKKIDDGVSDKWIIRSFGEIASKPQYGWTTRAKRGPGVKLLRTTDITHGTINWETVPSCQKGPPDLAKYRLKPGDLVVSRAGSVGFSSLIDESCPEEAVFASYLMRMRPDPDRVRPKFLHYFMESLDYWRQVSSASVGIGLANVNGSKLSAMTIPIPPLSEQDVLIRTLDYLGVQRAAANSHLVRARRVVERFRQSVLAAACSGRLTESWRESVKEGQPPLEEVHDVLERPYTQGDWPEEWSFQTVGEVFRIQNGRAFPSKQYGVGEMRLLRPGNLTANGEVTWEEKRTARLPSRWAEDFPDYVLGQGELLINLTAQSLKDEFLGRVCLKTDPEPALLNQRIARFINRQADDARPFALLYFKSRFFRSFVDGLDSGTLIRHMHSKQIECHKMPVPPIDEQAEIVRRTNQLLNLASGLAKQIEFASELLARGSSAVLAKAFRGELVPSEERGG